MTRETRVRFAPSPTGPLHMGGVRTALYNYLFAKKKNGKFILRIEDTDSQRFVPGAEKYIIDALTWCGITPNEGVENGQIVEIPSATHPFAPYRQSQRKELYKKYAFELVEKGCAYYAFDSPDSLDRLRAESEQAGNTFIYNHSVRDGLDNSLSMKPSQIEERLKESDKWVIRFKIPVNRVVKMTDLIRGEIEIDSNTLDDKVLWKASDQLPTYHLANVVDDKLMEISDVIRGEEWLPSLPLHYLLYDALGWNDLRPAFAHLSLLLKPDGKGKLSKRDGDRLGFPVFPLKWVSETGEVSRGYREDGYLPDAFINMLAFLGWNPGNEQEIFSLEQLTDAFTLERVIKSGAKFNPDKAKWYNHEYLKRLSTRQLVDGFIPILNEKGISRDIVFITHVVELIRERATFIQELWELSHYFFLPPLHYDQKVKDKFWNNETPLIMSEVIEKIKTLQQFTKETIDTELPLLIKEKGWPMGVVMNCLRLSLVGESKGPAISDIMSLLGKEETISRISGLIHSS